MADRKTGPKPPPANRRAAKTVTLSALRTDARECRACDLWKRGTQTVFGEGPSRATLMLVGEQPGDAEDLSGRPFVGPSIHRPCCARPTRRPGVAKRRGSWTI